MNKPLISVIVPVYNSAKYLEQCVDSIINQTYENLEIILVDDGSTDGSSDLCDSIKKRDKRITVIHKKNGGAASARNAGLKLAKGEFIGFADSDDWLELDMFQHMFEVLNKNDADLVLVSLFLEYEIENKSVKSPKISGTFNSTQAVHKQLYHEDGFCGAPWDKLYKRELFDNLEFPEGLITEDYYVNGVIYSKLNRMVVDSGCYYHYRMQENSVCHQPVNIHTYDEIKTAQKLIEFYKENNVAQKLDYDFYLALSYHHVLYNLVIKGADRSTIKKYQKTFNNNLYKCIFNFKVSNFKKIKMLLFGFNPMGYKKIQSFLKKYDYDV